ncbi:hypothetical protein P175DRAFT_0498766 [Aspergillus ochraceoroseus IBT 24754]|uniref:Uncharacterized protein n=1 Tax=Aspergillus ochraceoroseus IBT 24754 TaxID=1392256 RepID=A0A2T5MAW4_9EURO|nr:uncharacterized protein P175DRAFT_0498766 [Aspergillus ochraceoroseus IBT 24754]PTU25676.1 hypothetical protein P175DRAFT_0498766 [Aspergillus ochraceoroseus IBT 24754]
MEAAFQLTEYNNRCPSNHSSAIFRWIWYDNTASILAFKGLLVFPPVCGWSRTPRLELNGSVWVQVALTRLWTLGVLYRGVDGSLIVNFSVTVMPPRGRYCI